MTRKRKHSLLEFVEVWCPKDCKHCQEGVEELKRVMTMDEPKFSERPSFRITPEWNGAAKSHIVRWHIEIERAKQ